MPKQCVLSSGRQSELGQNDPFSVICVEATSRGSDGDEEQLSHIAPQCFDHDNGFWDSSVLQWRDRRRKRSNHSPRSISQHLQPIRESGASFQLCNLGWRAIEENEEIIALGMRWGLRIAVQRATRDGWARIGLELQSYLGEV